MKYKNILPLLKNYKKILVTGPHRSGTRITTQILSRDLQLPYIDEWNCELYNYPLFIKATEEFEKFVMQGPSMTAFIQDFPEDVLIIFMIRNREDVMKSQDRIQWKYEDAERAISLGRFNCNKSINWNGRSYDVKMEIWNKIQKKIIKNSWFELDYESLKDHKLWFNKDKRKEFEILQTRKKTEKGDIWLPRMGTIV